MKPIEAPRPSEPVVDHPIDQVAVADEVDPLDAGRAVGDAGAGQQRVDRTAALVDGGVDRGLLGEVQVDGLGAGEGDLGEVHHHDLGAGVERQLGGGGTHSGGTTDDEHALAIESECVELRHVWISCVLVGGSGRAYETCATLRWADRRVHEHPCHLVDGVVERAVDRALDEPISAKRYVSAPSAAAVIDGIELGVGEAASLELADRFGDLLAVATVPLQPHRVDLLVVARHLLDHAHQARLGAVALEVPRDGLADPLAGPARSTARG